MNDSSFEPPNKRKKKGLDTTVAAQGPGWNLMKKAGYVTGQGLGALGQGRVAPVEESNQIGRRGLGFANDSSYFEKPPDVWDPDNDTFSATSDLDQMKWVDNYNHVNLNRLPSDWIDIDERKLDINEEFEFCDPDVLKRVLQYKSVFDSMDGRKMMDARTRSNPYETIKNVFFLNRAALKMANIDKLTEFALTTSIEEDEILYFADICAGPGGFTEYLLWRKAMKCRGFGFTLRGSNDFKLNTIVAGPVECFSAHYGADDDGDVYKPENLDHFATEVFNEAPEGLHLVVADGGFSVEGQENIQEILSKQLYLCQFIFGLALLRPGGHFVCKLFDTFTPFSAGLIFLMSHAFESYTICKPVTSRPANSERYIICRNLLATDSVKSLLKYLRKVNAEINRLKNSLDDVMGIVPIEEMRHCPDFMNHLEYWNNTYGHQQVIGLDKIKAYADDSSLMEMKKETIREACLNLWKIPDLTRYITPWPLRNDLNMASVVLLRDSENGKFAGPSKDLLPSINNLSLETCNQDKFVPLCYEAFLGSKNPPFLVYSRGLSEVYIAKDYAWTPWASKPPRLPAGTMLWLWDVPLYKTSTNIVNQFHIVDAICIYGKDLRNLPLQDRLNEAKEMLKVIAPPSIPIQTMAQPQQKGLIQDRKRRITEIDNMRSGEQGGQGDGERVVEKPAHLQMGVQFNLADLLVNKDRLQAAHVELRKAKRIPMSLPMWHMHTTSEGPRDFFALNYILLVKTIQDPWISAYSHSQKRYYYFNVKTRQSVFDRPKESIPHFGKGNMFAVKWWDGSERMQDTDTVTLKELLSAVEQRLPKL